MSYKRLFIWVEGSDDNRFFSNIVKPLLQIKYDWIDIVEYARETKKWRKNFINSIRNMNADYIFVGDIDLHQCSTLKKEDIRTKLNNVDISKIIIVIKEIEGWYLSGLDADSSDKLGINFCGNTDNITKEDFDRLQPKQFDSRVDFMWEIMKIFSCDIAVGNNRSFKYFTEEYLK